MKKFLSLIAAVAFAATALVAEAATPKAAEDPSATVVSTSAPAPKVKKANHATAKKHGAKKPAKAKAKAKKKVRKAH